MTRRQQAITTCINIVSIWPCSCHQIVISDDINHNRPYCKITHSFIIVRDPLSVIHMGSRKAISIIFIYVAFPLHFACISILMRHKMVLIINHCYNMACSALFFQRALYTVQCANIMHSRKPSFVITPPFLINSINRYLKKYIYPAIKYATFHWNDFI